MTLDDDQILQLIRSVDPARGEDIGDPPSFDVVRARIAARPGSPKRSILHWLGASRLGLFVLGAMLLGGGAAALAATGVIRISAPVHLLLATNQRHVQGKVERHRPRSAHAMAQAESAKATSGAHHRQLPKPVDQVRQATAKPSKMIKSARNHSNIARTGIPKGEHRNNATTVGPTTTSPPLSSTPPVMPATTTGTATTGVGTTTGATTEGAMWPGAPEGPGWIDHPVPMGVNPSLDVLHTVHGTRGSNGTCMYSSSGGGFGDSDYERIEVARNLTTCEFVEAEGPIQDTQERGPNGERWTWVTTTTGTAATATTTTGTAATAITRGSPAPLSATIIVYVLSCGAGELRPGEVEKCHPLENANPRVTELGAQQNPSVGNGRVNPAEGKTTMHVQPGRYEIAWEAGTQYNGPQMVTVSEGQTVEVTLRVQGT